MVSGSNPATRTMMTFFQIICLLMLINVRQELIVNDTFTSEEYYNTLKYIDLLEDEKYEELSKFKIQENE